MPPPNPGPAPVPVPVPSPTSTPSPSPSPSPTPSPSPSPTPTPSPTATPSPTPSPDPSPAVVPVKPNDPTVTRPRESDPLSGTIRRASTLVVRVGAAVAPRVQGLPADGRFSMQVRDDSSWAFLGTFRSGPRGGATLPAFRIESRGTYVLRIPIGSSQYRFLKVRGVDSRRLLDDDAGASVGIPRVVGPPHHPFRQE